MHREEKTKREYISMPKSNSYLNMGDYLHKRLCIIFQDLVLIFMFPVVSVKLPLTL